MRLRRAPSGLSREPIKIPYTPYTANPERIAGESNLIRRKADHPSAENAVLEEFLCACATQPGKPYGARVFVSPKLLSY